MELQLAAMPVAPCTQQSMGQQVSLGDNTLQLLEPAEQGSLGNDQDSDMVVQLLPL